MGRRGPYIPAGLDSANAVAAFGRIRGIVAELAHELGAEEFERARASAAGRRALALENSTAAARQLAEELVVHGSDIEPADAIASLDSVTHAEVTAVAEAVDGDCSLACVGPHSATDFEV